MSINEYKPYTATIGAYGGKYIVCVTYAVSYDGDNFSVLGKSNYECLSRSAAIDLIAMINPDRVIDWDIVNPDTVFPCRVCGEKPYIPEPVDDGDRQHHQICCSDCGAEVVNTAASKCADIWNDLMSPSCDCA